MNSKSIKIFLICIFISTGCLAQETLVPITAISSTKTASRGERLQIRLTGDSIQVWGFNLWSLPPKVKRINFQQPKEKVNLASMRGSAAQSLDKTYKLLSDTSLGYKSRLASIKSYQHLKDKFLKRKKSSAYFKNQWVLLGALAGTAKEHFSFITRGFLRNRARYQIDFLPGATAGKLPALDPWNCIPAEERFFRLRKLQGYGVDKFTYKPCVAPKREILRKQYEVFFPVNSAIPDPAGIQEVIDFLVRNHYEILSATMEGGCSIEGDSAKNHALQVKRASVLSKALKQYNNSRVRRDTVLLADTWRQFRELLSYSEFKALDSLNNQDLRKKINRDPAVRTALEPLLSIQRKASLAMAMAKVFTYDERLIKLESELSAWTSKLLSQPQNQKLAEANIMGMLDFLFLQYVEKEITEAALDEILERTGFGDYLHTLLGYHLIKQFEEGANKSSGTQWTNYWNDNNLENWFRKCQQKLITLAGGTFDTATLKKYKLMLADYQAYSYRFIQLGLMDINSLCEVHYPDRPVFINLQLYQYGFLYEMSATQGKQISCIGLTAKSSAYKKDSVGDTDAFLEQARREIGIKSTVTTTSNGNRIPKVTFDRTPRSPYYVLLREKFVLGHDYATDAFEYVDGAGPVELDAFNLMHLLMPNVSAWDPANRYFYDKFIQLEELDKLITKLKKVDGSICDPQVNQLYLDYHLKALYYLDLYFEPGNERQTKIAEASLRYIDEYYRARTAAINSNLSMHIVKQLNLFNWLPGAGTGATYGYDLLKTIAKKRLLNDDELKLYAHYVRLFDPNFQNALPSFYTEEQIIKLAKEPYGQPVFTSTKRNFYK